MTAAMAKPTKTHEHDLLDQLAKFDEMMRLLVRSGVTYHSFRANMLRLYVTSAVAESDGNYTEAARKIGLHRNAVRAIMGSKAVTHGVRPQANGSGLPSESERSGGA